MTLMHYLQLPNWECRGNKCSEWWIIEKCLNNCHNSHRILKVQETEHCAIFSVKSESVWKESSCPWYWWPVTDKCGAKWSMSSWSEIKIPSVLNMCIFQRLRISNRLKPWRSSCYFPSSVWNKLAPIFQNQDIENE